MRQVRWLGQGEVQRGGPFPTANPPREVDITTIATPINAPTKKSDNTALWVIGGVLVVGAIALVVK